MEIIALIFVGIILFCLVRDIYLSLNKPDEYIKILRKRYQFKVSLFPFLRGMGYPDEKLALQSSKFALPLLMISVRLFSLEYCFRFLNEYYGITLQHSTGNHSLPIIEYQLSNPKLPNHLIPNYLTPDT